MRKLFQLKPVVLFAAAAFLLSSCQVEMTKRLYGSGYYIDWNWKQSETQKVRPQHTVASKKEVQTVSTNVQLVNSESRLASQPGQELTKMQSVKSKLLARPNAHRQHLQSSVSRSVPQIAISPAPTQVKAVNNVSSTHENMAGRNWTVAVVLGFVSVLLLPLSLHRFYLGYIGIAILQIVLTLLIIGWIWQVVDLIRILMRNLQPKDGSYDS